MFKFNKLKRFLQGETRNTRFLMRAARDAGYSPVEVRRGLIAFHEINISQLAQGQPISPDLLYQVRDGKSRNPLGMRLISDALGLEVGEVFPDTGDGSVPMQASAG